MNCPLEDGRAVALALELTDSALAKVDPTDTARNAYAGRPSDALGQLPVRQGEDRSQRPSGLRRPWRDQDPAEHDPPYMPQASQVGGQVAVYDYYIGVVPAPKTPLRPAEPDRRSCAAGRSDERRHSAGYLAELDHRLGVPTVSLDAADARVVTEMNRTPKAVICRTTDIRISTKNSGVTASPSVC